MGNTIRGFLVASFVAAIAGGAFFFGAPALFGTSLLETSGQDIVLGAALGSVVNILFSTVNLKNRQNAVTEAIGDDDLKDARTIKAEKAAERWGGALASTALFLAIALFAGITLNAAAQTEFPLHMLDRA